jgi:2-methylisocitrate lyase-like PEP mutase family enzyme
MKRNLGKKLKTLIYADELLLMPQCYDALSARIVENVGFKAANLGGFGVGVTLGHAEHLLSLTEMVDVGRNVAKSVDIPIVADADGGFGSALHMQRTIQEFEDAGIAGVYIEDQYYPKRAHYFKGIKHTISAEEMILKIKAALEARQNPDFVIIARTDSLLAVEGGVDEAIKRANLYLNAGADAIFPMPGGAGNLEDASKLAKGINGPACYSISEYKIGCSDEVMDCSVEEISKMGYKMLSHPITATLVAADAIRNVYKNLLDCGRTGINRVKAKEIRNYVQQLKNLDDHLEVEKKYNIEK